MELHPSVVISYRAGFTSVFVSGAYAKFMVPEAEAEAFAVEASAALMAAELAA